MKELTEAEQSITSVCPFCWGSGVVLAIEDGSLIRAGEWVINQNLKWAACPECTCSPISNPVPILRDIDTESHGDPNRGGSQASCSHAEPRVVV